MTSPLVAWATGAQLDSDPKTWPPEKKIELITAMGFVPVRDDHQPDCPAAISPRDYICQCVPDSTVWAQPLDVDEYRHETWEERRAASIKRQAAQR